MKRLLLLIGVLVVAGCITAKTEFLSPRRFEPIPPDSVTVFAGVAELQADSIGYERLAMIFLKGSQSFTDQRGMMKKAREEAAMIGANGIIVSSMAEGAYNAFLGGENPRQGTIIAVRWWVIEPKP